MAIADITVKKADGSTNVTYNAAVGSAGDKLPAVWTQNSFSGVAGNRPRFEMSASNNGANSVRQVSFSFVYPSLYTDTNTGLERVNRTVEFKNGVLFLPKDITTTEWSEAWAQLGNLLSSTAVRDSVATGYPPQ